MLLALTESIDHILLCVVEGEKRRKLIKIWNLRSNLIELRKLTNKSKIFLLPVLDNFFKLTEYDTFYFL